MLGQAVAVAVACREVAEQGFHRRPCGTDEGVAVGTRGDRIAPGLQHELGAEVLPVVDVLVVVAVRSVERVVVRPADVVGHGPADLAHGVRPGRHDPDDRRVVDGDRGQQVADATTLELRVEPEDGERRVEVHIDAVEVRVVGAFEQGEPARVGGVGLRAVHLAGFPEAPAVDEEVELVEEGCLVPVGPLVRREDRPLPGLDRPAPARRLGQGVAGEVERPLAGPAPRPRVALPPAPAGAELDDREVPGDRETKRPSLARCEVDGRSDGCSERLAGRTRASVVRWIEPTVRGEIGPDLAVRAGIEPAPGGHGHAGRAGRRHGERPA